MTKREEHTIKFNAILDELKDLHERKNNNYSSDEEPLANLRACKSMGISPVTGVVLRLGDKYSRLCELSKGKPDLVGESMKDTFRDMAVYAILAMMLLDEEIVIDKHPTLVI